MNGYQVNIFAAAEGSSSIMVDDYSLDDVRGRYEKKFGKIPWLEGKQLDQLEKMLYYGLRYNAQDNEILCLQLLNQAVLQGIGVVMGKLTPEAGEFYRRARQVWAETHRVKGFIRFQPVRNHPGALVGRAEFRHRIEDILLKYFRNRYPGQQVFLLRGTQAFFLQGHHVRAMEIRKLRLDFNEHEFDLYWNTYYDSQVIEGRLNKKLARKHIPKKLWSWVPEGEKLK